MDYGALRTEAMALLGKLAGHQWTDHNIHDPGITILEQLCYAITDIAYRTEFPIADLVASAGIDSWPPAGAEILVGDPVTEDDLRALLLAEGVKALRIASVQATEHPLYFHELDGASGKGDLKWAPPSLNPTASPLQIKGLRQVWVESSRVLQVREQLHRCRLLGEDVGVEALASTSVAVFADLEVGFVDDPAALLDQIFACLQATISPKPGQPFPDAIHSSDLLHALLDLPQMRAVRSISLANSSQEQPKNRQPWLLRIPSNSLAVIDLDSPIQLFCDGVPLPPPTQPTARTRSQPWPDARPTAEALAPALSAAPSHAPAGRARNLQRFSSLRRHLPAAYGVGPDGLGAGASPERRALAQQLEAYLLIFDQLLSNALAQLALAPELLSPAAPAQKGNERSYGCRPVEDPPLGWDQLIQLGSNDQESNDYASWLQEAVEPADPRERRQQFLAHLLARFGEELTPPGLQPAELLALRREFLTDIARMGGARGSGVNILEPAATLGGFEERLRRKLGFPPVVPDGSGDQPLLVIEHLLLRALPEDFGQINGPALGAGEGEETTTFLSEVACPDPWSFQVSVVINAALLPSDEKTAANMEQRVAQTLTAELPAHLTPRLWWFGDDDWTQLLQAWGAFRILLAADRGSKATQATLPPSPQHLAFRDARDRLLELLEIGLPWPLRDIPLPAELVVARDQPAPIDLGYSQTGVRYELWEKDAANSVPSSTGVVSHLDGNGTSLQFITPAVQQDVIYRVRAVKFSPAHPGQGERQERAAWLQGEVRVIEGINTTLVPKFVNLPTLSPDDKTSSTVLCAYGTDVTVRIPMSQNGITYDLIDRAKEIDLQPGCSTTSEHGTGGPIDLVVANATEDCDLQVRARRTVATTSGLQVALLETILLLRVRANPAIPLALVSPVASHGENGRLQLGNAQMATQHSVCYQLWRRPIPDEAFVTHPCETHPWQPPPEVEEPNLKGPEVEGRPIRVVVPPETAEPQTLKEAGFLDLADPVPGNGAILAFDDLGPARADSTWLALAIKEHKLDRLDVSGSGVVPSTVKLAQAAVQLVRPRAAVPLTLVRMPQNQWQLFGGEPGVFYRFSQDDQPLDTEAYVHQWDDQDPSVAKGLGGMGIGGLRVEVDLAIAPNPLDPRGTQDKGPPVIPQVKLDLALARPLQVRARRAMTGLKADLTVAPLLVRVEPVTVPKGSTAQILLVGRPGETYALRLNGQPVDAPKLGEGTGLAFTTGALSQTTIFELVITLASGGERSALVRVPVEQGAS